MAPYRIRVNSIAPGAIRTPINTAAWQTPAAYEALLTLVPYQHELLYDHLVLALGSITNFFNLPGLEDQALTMKSLGDAIQVRNRMIANLEEASSECTVQGRASLLSVVVAGGGFAGVETIAGINDFLWESIACYPNLSAELLRIVLVHPGEIILPVT